MSQNPQLIMHHLKGKSLTDTVTSVPPTDTYRRFINTSTGVPLTTYKYAINRL